MRAKHIALILISAVVLSGCAGVPTSSRVYFGEEISEDVSTQFVRVIARPPSPGMSPEEIVRGFLDACADPSENYGIARQYLEDESAGKWNPSTGIEIYEASTVEVLGNSPTLTVQTGKLGTISDIGRFQSADPGAQISKTFELGQDSAGQWRISKLSDGTLLSAGDVDRSFRSFPIYFFDIELKSLITDNVLVPVSNSGAATSLVRSLLDGPSPYLSPVAASAFPVGTTLTYGSVPVTDGTAQVDLSKEVLGADETTRRAISAQLVWTLSQLPNVTSVQISVSGQSFAPLNVAPLQSIGDWEFLSTLPDPLAVELNVIRNEKIYQLKNGVESVRLTAPSSLLSSSLNQDGSKVAAVTADRKSILISNGSDANFEVAAQGEQISEPTWDRLDNLFFADVGQGVQEILADGTVRDVLVDTSILGTADQVEQIEIAADGVRVALVLSDGIQDVVAVGAIFKTETETRIIGLHRIERDIALIRDIAWTSPTSIAAIGSDNSTNELLFDISLLDGKTRFYSTPVGVQQVLVDGSGKLYVSAVDGREQSVYQQSFGSWSQVATGIGGFFSR
jgi:hypothetical protein